MNTKFTICTSEPRPQVLLYGNGIEQSYGADSWRKIIEGALKRSKSGYMYDDIKNLPANMQIVVATGNRVDSEMKAIKEQLLRFTLTEEHKALYRDIFAIKADTIMTTNYDYHFEQALGCGNTEKSFQKTRRWTRDKATVNPDYNIYQFTKVNSTVGPHLWHIHGDVCRKNSMIMGHYYYGKILSQVQQQASLFIRRYKSARAKGYDCEAESWIDYFLSADVYMVGFAMYLTEVDLWWLLECKFRNFPDSRVYYYQPNGFVDKDIRKMLSLYHNVHIIDSIELKKTDMDTTGFREFYHTAIENINLRILDKRKET